ncbi:hypothetical protein D3C78_1408860 [compost metagenome]
MRQGFEHEHARHDGTAGEMSLEIRLIERDVLDGLDALVALKFQHLVYQQKRVAVRQLLENCVDIHHCVPILLPCCCCSSSALMRSRKLCSCFKVAAFFSHLLFSSTGNIPV